MQRNAWHPVYHGDEYAEVGDTDYFDGSQYSYYWNPVRMRLRRYGLDGSYLEIACLGKPQAGVVSTLIAQAKAQGRLLAYEAPHAVAA